MIGLRRFDRKFDDAGEGGGGGSAGPPGYGAHARRLLGIMYDHHEISQVS